MFLPPSIFELRNYGQTTPVTFCSAESRGDKSPDQLLLTSVRREFKLSANGALATAR
jgi:hypothetical protein